VENEERKQAVEKWSSLEGRSFFGKVRSGFLLSLSLSCFLFCHTAAMAQTMFSGITSIDARPVQDPGVRQDPNVQILRFEADLPFQYQKQVLDIDTIRLRIYNARLTNRLLTPEGSINLLAGGFIQTANLKAFDRHSAQAEPVQELILHGPGLGQKVLKVVGAEERLAPRTPTAKASSLMMARTSVSSVRHQRVATRKVFHSGNFKNLQELTKNGGVIRDDVHPAAASESIQKIYERPEIANKPANVQSRIDPDGINAHPVMSAVPASTENMALAAVLDDTVSGRKPEPADAEPLNASAKNEDLEPDNTPMTAMPRYTGGAKPIQAITTDNKGYPVLIQPKSQVIPEFSVGKANGGYNTLFQADMASDSRSDYSGKQGISLALRDASMAFKANQYDLALKQIQKGLVLDANNADLLAALAEIQLKQGQTAMAQQNYQRAEARAHTKYGLRYAQVLTLTGQRKEAIQLLEGLYQQNPKQEQVAYMLGTLHEELGETGPALTYLQQAAQLHPGSADIQYNLGLAYELSGDREQAEKHYHQAAGLNATAPDVTKALARLRNTTN
jgi:Flp pilus assembly protein TadD